MEGGAAGAENAQSRLAAKGMEKPTLEALYEAHAKTVYWAAYGVSRDAEAAADAVQNAFLSAHRNMGTIETMTNEQARAWLYRVAVNSAIDMLRRNRRSIPMEDAGVTETDMGPGPEAQAEKNETRQAIKKALDNLPEKYREPLFLYYFAELDYHQIAALLQTGEGTLKSRMSRGRDMLKNELAKGGGLYA